MVSMSSYLYVVLAALLACSSGSTSNVLNLLINDDNLPNFQQRVFNQRFDVINRNSSEAADFLAQLQQLEPSATSLLSIGAFVEYFETELHHAPQEAVTFFDSNADEMNAARALKNQSISELLASGVSVVVKREHQYRLESVSLLQTDLQRQFGTETTVHAYVSPSQAQALKPHTDPYDVFVVQVSGEKDWTICTPQPQGAEDVLSDAYKAQLQEILRNNIQGCTSYTQRDLEKMDCQHITLQPGHVLYMPKGIVHYATTRANATSTHLTVGLQRKGHTWRELFHRHCRLSNSDAICHQLDKLIAEAAITPEGLVWNDLATSPFTASLEEGICEQLVELTTGQHPTALIKLLAQPLQKANTYEMSAGELRSHLPDLSRCQQTHGDLLLALPAKTLARARRYAYTASCVTDKACHSALSCDCTPTCRCDGGFTCFAGYFRPNGNTHGACSTCWPGTYQDREGQPSCKVCPAGKYSDRKASSCRSCPAGKYQPSTEQSTCLNAGAGYYVASQGSSTRTACPAGWFSTGATEIVCRRCWMAPFPGTYQPQTGQSRCLACASGKHATRIGATSCATLSLTVNPIFYPTSIFLDVSTDRGKYSAFRVTLGIQRTSEFTWDLASGYPRVYNVPWTPRGLVFWTNATLPDLIPGHYYYIKVEVQPLDLYTTRPFLTSPIFELPLAQTSCGCGAETTGAPTNFVVSQYFGKVSFKWTDSSYCEDGFVFQRDNTGFTSAYDVLSSAACGRTHQPETVYDDITASEDLVVGQTYTYCINAYSHTRFNWAPAEGLSPTYSSTSVCQSHQIQWESRLIGYVQLSDDAGKLPVPDTLVSWTIGNGALSGNTTTDEDGKFTIYIRTDLLNKDYEDIVVSVAKNSSRIQHRYECDGQPCSERRVLLQALSFDREVMFTDVSTVPFTGHVSIKGTEHDAFPNGCPLAQVQVCLIDHIHHTQLGCALTDSMGYYAVPVAFGLSVYPVPTFNNHTFELLDTASTRPISGTVDGVSPGGLPVQYAYYAINEDSDILPVDFVDSTSSKIQLSVAGGKCNRTLGTSTVRFTYNTCASTWNKDVVFMGWQTTQAMPAQAFEAQLWDVTHSTVDIGDMVPKYLTTVGTVRQDANMVSEPVQLRWEYHPEPKLRLDIDRSPANGCNALVLPRNVETDVTVFVVEPFWGGQPDCTWIEGNVSLRNQIGESVRDTQDLLDNNGITSEQASLLSRCAEGCDLELELDRRMITATETVEYHSARATIRTMTGEPETVATINGVQYAKPITVSIDTGVYAVSEVFPVIVTGQKLISDRFTMDFPEYFPLMVLYDPPGGQSYAWYKAAQSSITLTHKEHVAYNGGYAKANLGVNFQVEQGVCIGIGVQGCNEVASIAGKAGVDYESHHLRATVKASGNKDSSATITTQFTLSTSRDYGVPSGHLFVTPSLTVKFSETRVITYNLTRCQAGADTIITWALGQDGNNLNSFTLKSYNDIKSSEIPTLEANLNAAKQELTDLQDAIVPNTVLISDQRNKIAKVEEAIKGWKSVLNRTDQVLQDAELDKLDAVTNLMPQSLMNDARDLDDSESKAPGAAAAMKNYHTLSFTGGGQTYEYSEFNSTSDRETKGSRAKDTIKAGVIADLTARVSGIGPWVVAGGGYQREVSNIKSESNGTSTETSQGFVLRDDDVGDKFVIKVSRDPLFKTFVFTTVAGSSECPHEKNTYAREQPQITLLESPPSDVLPAEAAVFRVLLLNAANEDGQYELYVRDLEGADVRVNGASLIRSHLYEQMPPSAQYEETIYVTRGSNKYSFDFKLGFRSRCEREEFLTTGNWPASEFMSEELSLTAEFLEACSLVSWAGTMERERRFVVNNDVKSGVIEVKVYNPESPDRPWANNQRLTAVPMEYRRVGDLAWRAARLVNGSAMDFIQEESPFGYSKLYWHVGGVPDGDYEIRVKTQCTPAGLDPPEGINQALSTVITGVLDRVAPDIFSHVPEPADGVFNAGDRIAVEMTEAIQCSRPFSFNIQAAIGDSIVVQKTALDIVCEGRLIEVSLVNRFSPSTLAGSQVEITLSSVRDMAGNVMSSPIQWSFAFEANSAAKPSSVIIENMRLNTPFNPAWEDTTSDEYRTTITALRRDFAAFLQVDISRISITELQQSDNGQTATSITIRPPTQNRRRNSDENADKSADELAVSLLAIFDDETANTSTMFGNSSLLSTLDTSQQPEQRVEQPEASLNGAEPSDGANAQARATDENVETLVTIDVILTVVVLLQAAVLIWLILKTRTNLMTLVRDTLSSSSKAATFSAVSNFRNQGSRQNGAIAWKPQDTGDGRTSPAETNLDAVHTGGFGFESPDTLNYMDLDEVDQV
eukprot:m.59743 g.59743  ORF g.59743 m.59743 type:complete len:2336 (-) comp13823_c0_seq5:1666-8673(-)